MTDTSIPLKKYYKFFALTYGGLIIAAMLISMFVYELNGSFSWALLFSSSLVIAQLFAKDHKRLPSAHEKHRLIWGCLSISFAVSLALATILGSLVLFIDYGLENSSLVLNELLQQANTDAGMVFFFAMLLGLGITLILSYLTLWFTFTFMVKSFLRKEWKAMNKKPMAPQ